MMTKRSLTAPLAGLAMLLALTGCTSADQATLDASPAASAAATPTATKTTTAQPKATKPAPATTSAAAKPAKTTAGSARAALDTLAVKGRAPKTGYDRELFGQAWADVDRNGCDTRNDILARDLQVTSTKPGTGGCVVLTGTLNDPFTATAIDFERGPRSSEVQIDHVVPLSLAWQTGAQQLSAADRVAFANDPLNLLAVDGPANGQKSDSDAASWLPANKGFRCDYVARQVAVKAKYTLWVTTPEKDAIARVLDTCPGQELPDAGSRYQVSPGQAAQAERSTPAPHSTQDAVTPHASSGSGGSPFKNCAAAKAAGAAPVKAGDPGYGKHLDRDGDGVGCES